MDDPRFDHLPDETLSPVPEHAPLDPDPRLSRRRLLGGAGGGFALAASGLLVPEGVAGVERQRPVERILNDPRDRKDRNDKNRNRKDRNRKDRNDNDRQAIQKILDVEINYYSGYTLTREIEVWQGGPYVPLRPKYELKSQRHSVSPGPTSNPRTLEKFTGSSPILVLVVFTNIETGPLIIKVENPPVGAPSLAVGQGTWDKNGWVNRGHIYFNKGVDVGQRVEVPGFYIDRSGDSPNHKIFYVNAKD